MFEGIDVGRNNGSQGCSISHYCYFLEINFRFQALVCNGYHNLMQKAMTFNNVAIFYLKGNDYRLNFCICVKVKI